MAMREWPSDNRCSVAARPPAQFVVPTLGTSAAGWLAGSTTTSGMPAALSARHCSVGSSDGPIARVVVLIEQPLDPGARGRGDVGATVQHLRHGRQRDAGLAGDERERRTAWHLPSMPSGPKHFERARKDLDPDRWRISIKI